MRKNIIKVVVFCFVIFGFSTFSFAKENNIGTISVNGNGFVYVEPDTAVINAGISVYKINPKEAMATLSDKALSIVNKLKKHGIDKKNIQTSSLSLNPIYRYDKEKKRDILAGYRASELFTIKTEIKSAGNIIGDITQSGANSISGIYFTSSKFEQLKLNAIEKAVKDAHLKAESAIKDTHYKISGIKYISINSFYQPRGRYNSKSLSFSRASSIPIESGNIKIAASVHITYFFK